MRCIGLAWAGPVQTSWVIAAVDDSRHGLSLAHRIDLAEGSDVKYKTGTPAGQTSSMSRPTKYGTAAVVEIRSREKIDGPEATQICGVPLGLCGAWERQ
jgi:hypothetical protein